MKSFITHTTCLIVAVFLATPLFAANGAHAQLAKGHLPWIAGSFFISALWALFLAMTIFAPVASITHYLVEYRWQPRWFFEPLLLAVVLMLYSIPVALLVSQRLSLIAPLLVLSLYFPTLIYYLVLRAINLRADL